MTATFGSYSSVANASFSVLPYSQQAMQMTKEECMSAIKKIDILSTEERNSSIAANNEQSNTILTCAIKTGNIKFWMVTFFIRNILQFAISLAGLISTLMIMVGAYYYMAGGLTDDKEKGKTIITYAIGGLILTTIAWVLVNIILLAVTS